MLPFDIADVVANNIDQLEANGASNLRSPGGTFRWYAIGIDLSDLGYDAGAKVNGLFIQGAGSDNLDPTLIVGLRPVPEPATAGLAGLAAMGLMMRRRR